MLIFNNSQVNIYLKGISISDNDCTGQILVYFQF